MEKKLQKAYFTKRFIDKARFIESSLSSLVNNLAKGIRKTKCKCKYGNKKI